MRVERGERSSGAARDADGGRGSILSPFLGVSSLSDSFAWKTCFGNEKAGTPVPMKPSRIKGDDVKGVSQPARPVLNEREQ